MITLETAKALKENGWSKETQYCFYDYNSNGGWSYIESKYCNLKLYPVIFRPSLEELLGELPYKLERNNADYRLSLKKFDGEYQSRYYSAFFDTTMIEEWAEDPVEACALLWIKLKKEGLV
jgi:hypothetical protein